MNNEPNKPIEAEELTEKELEGVVGGAPTLALSKYSGTDVKIDGKELKLMQEGYLLGVVEK